MRFSVDLFARLRDYRFAMMIGKQITTGPQPHTIPAYFTERARLTFRQTNTVRLRAKKSLGHHQLLCRVGLNTPELFSGGATTL